jgi:multidrug transporter EmrE-like cation transporter
MVWLLLILGVVLNAAAQLFLKAGMNQIGYFEFTSANALPVGLKIATSIPIISGLITYVLSVGLWLLVLSRVQVSIAYPMVSIGYILNALLAYYLFAEPMTSMRTLGILIIIAGVFLVARSA